MNNICIPVWQYLLLWGAWLVASGCCVVLIISLRNLIKRMRELQALLQSQGRY